MWQLRGNALWCVPVFFLTWFTPLVAQSAEQALVRAQQEQSAGQYALAASDYAKATRQQPAVPELWANRGLMEYLAGQTAPSIVSLNRALKLNPSLVSPLLFLGKAYMDTGRPKDAVPLLERARHLRPEDPQILLALGKAYDGVRDWSRAAEVHDAAVTLDPKLAAAWFALGVDRLSLIDDQGRRLARVTPKNTWASALYADELMTQGRTAEAVARYQELAAAASTREAACLLHTVREESTRATEATEANAQEAIVAALTNKAGTTAPGCEPQQAATAYWSGRYAASAAAAGQRLRGAPDAPEAVYWLIKANEKSAVEALEHFAMLAPRSAASADLLGDLYRRRRQPDRAIEQYQRALALEPDDVVAWLGTSAAYFAAGQTRKSMDAARSGLERQPDHPQLNLLMAEGLVASHQYDSAKPYVERSRRVPAELLGRMHALAGTIAAHDGDTNTAIAELSQALPSDEDGSLHYQMYRLYKQAGRERDAEQAMAEVKAIEAQRREHAVVALHGTNGQSSN